MRKIRRATGAVLLCAVLMAGCLKSNTAPIPGSANSFDSGAYLTLVTTDSVIQTTKADLAANKFPASIAGNVKTALNGVIQAYNIANVTYQSYHTAAMAGQATPAQATAVTNALNNVQSATVALTTAKAGS